MKTNTIEQVTQLEQRLKKFDIDITETGKVIEQAVLLFGDDLSEREVETIIESLFAKHA